MGDSLLRRGAPAAYHSTARSLPSSGHGNKGLLGLVVLLLGRPAGAVEAEHSLHGRRLRLGVGSRHLCAISRVADGSARAIGRGPTAVRRCGEGRARLSGGVSGGSGTLGSPGPRWRRRARAYLGHGLAAHTREVGKRSWDHFAPSGILDLGGISKLQACMRRSARNTGSRPTLPLWTSPHTPHPTHP